MLLRRVNLLAEPCGQTYEGLLDFCLDYCEMALLVELFSLTGDGAVFMRQLAPYLVSMAQGSAWPGTVSGQKAKLHFFRYCAESADLLEKAVHGLYSWGQMWPPPEKRLLEDLSLFRKDGTPFLVTIGHERDAFLDLTARETALFRKRLPRLPVSVTEWHPLPAFSDTLQQ